MRRLVACSLALFCLTSVTSAAAVGAPHGTRKVVIDPVVAGGLAPGYEVVKTFRVGNCWTNSAVASGVVYRCLTHNLILDPCWSAPGLGGRFGSVVCPGLPWRKKLDRIVLSRRLPHLSAEPFRTRHVWGLVLGNGARCTQVQGAAGAFHGRGLAYPCNDRLSVLDPVRINHQPWRADTARYFAKAPHERRGPTLPVETAYYAESHR